MPKNVNVYYLNIDTSQIIIAIIEKGEPGFRRGLYGISQEMSGVESHC
jgi:hypothetical protein